jgi:hypothetical protein
MHQLIRTARCRVAAGYFKWPYQAAVINMLEQRSKATETSGTGKGMDIMVLPKEEIATRE